MDGLRRLGAMDDNRLVPRFGVVQWRLLHRLAEALACPPPTRRKRNVVAGTQLPKTTVRQAVTLRDPDHRFVPDFVVQLLPRGSD